MNTHCEFVCEDLFISLGICVLDDSGGCVHDFEAPAALFSEESHQPLGEEHLSLCVLVIFSFLTVKVVDISLWISFVFPKCAMVRNGLVSGLSLDESQRAAVHVFLKESIPPFTATPLF